MFNPFRKQIEEPKEILDTVQLELENLKEDHSKIVEELKNAQEEAASYQLKYTELLEQFEALKAEKETVESENLELVEHAVTIEESATEKAMEILAEVGVPPVEVTEDVPEPTLLEQFSALKGTDKQNFYTIHKQEIYAALKGQ